MSGETDWDGSPRVNEDGNLEVIARDEYGNRYTAVIFKGMLVGYRSGKSDPDKLPTYIVLFAGGELYVEVKDYQRDRETILNWVKGAK